MLSLPDTAGAIERSKKIQMTWGSCCIEYVRSDQGEVDGEKRCWHTNVTPGCCKVGLGPEIILKS